MESSSSGEFPNSVGEFSWWFLVYLLEGALIFLANAVTIVVFWRRRFALRKTAYLLINLAAADLQIGMGVVLLGVIGMTNHKSIPILTTALFFSTTASISSLTVIAVERAFAIARPLKHRTASAAGYYVAIGVVWVIAALVCGLIELNNYLDSTAPIYAILFVYCLCLAVISLSYAIVWCSGSKRPTTNIQRNVQNRKLARTLLIVIFLSLATVIPGQVLMVALNTGQAASLAHHLLVFLFVEFLNPLLNPFVYVLRMPDFRREISRLCKRQTVGNEVIEMPARAWRTFSQSVSPYSIGP